MSQTSILIGVLVLLLLVFPLGKFFGGGDPSPDAEVYQTVSLSNGQVYFGKLSVTPAAYILRDIFYLQTGVAPQPKGESKSETKLIKLGEEVHGPQDTMYIERTNLVYWEDMKPSSVVADAIAKYKSMPVSEMEKSAVDESAEKEMPASEQPKK